MSSNEVLNQKTKERYSLYAQFYPILALLAYYLIWRGNIFKHIRFFKELVRGKSIVLDIATGDGSLTAAALKPNKNTNIEKLVCLDISTDMLERAKKNLTSQKCEFIVGDVGQMPFQDQQFSVISCFGGLNSFPSIPQALKEIHRVLSSDGHVRGSALLLPESPWRQKKIHQWINEGYQTQTIEIPQFNSWIKEAGFQLTAETRIGDVLLFELKRS